MKKFDPKALKATLTVNGVEVEVVKLSERVPEPPLVPVGSDLYQDLCDIGSKLDKAGVLEVGVKRIYEEILIVPYRIIETDTKYTKADMMNTIIEITCATLRQYLGSNDEIRERLSVPFVSLDEDAKYIAALFTYAEMVLCSELMFNKYPRTTTGLTSIRASIINKETSKYNNGDFPYNVTP